MQREGKALVQWGVIDEELAKLPEAYKDSRFFSLQFVVETLTSDDPKRAVAALRSQHGRLDALIDLVVQGYHAAFSRSIQNYSAVLRLFTECKEEVRSLQEVLGNVAKYMGSPSGQLAAQWRKCVALEASVELLDELQGLAEAPARVEACLAARDGPGALALLLQSFEKLQRPELQQVPAVQQLRARGSSQWALLRSHLMAQLQSRLYAHALASSSASSRSNGANGSDPLAIFSAPPAAPGAHAGSRAAHMRKGSSAWLAAAAAAASSTSGMGAVLASPLATPRKANGAGGSPASIFRQRSTRRREPPGAGAAGATPARGGEPPPTPGRSPYRALAWTKVAQGAEEAEAERTAGGATGQRADGAGDPNQSSQAGFTASARELVACLAQMDGLTEARAHLHAHLPAELRKLVVSVVEQAAARQQAPASSSGSAVQEAAAVTALLGAVTSSLLHALRAWAALLHVMAAAPAPPKRPGVPEAPHPAVQPGSAQPGVVGGASQPQHVAPAGPASGGGASLSSAALLEEAWGAAQAEVQVLLTDLLQLPAASVASSGTAGGSKVEPPARPAAGWLAELSDAGRRRSTRDAQPAPTAAGQRSKVAFAFDITVPGVDVSPSTDVPAIAAAAAAGARQGPEGGCYSGLLAKLLGADSGQEGSRCLRLVPVVYAPLVEFVDAAGSIVASARLPAAAPAATGAAAAAAGAGGAKRGQLFSNAAASGASGARPPSLTLKAFMTGLVSEAFLPQAVSSVQGRAAALLREPAALQTPNVSAERAVPLADASHGLLSGGAVPAAALGAEQLLRQVLGWAAALPLAAPQLQALAEGMLGDVLSACRVAMQAALQAAPAGQLAANAELSQLMALEPDAALLTAGPILFYTHPEHPQAPFEPQPLLAAIAAGQWPQLLDPSLPPEREALLFVQQACPADGAVFGLLSPTRLHTLLQLAALATCLGHIAGAAALQGGLPRWQPPSSRLQRLSANGEQGPQAAAAGAGASGLPSALRLLADKAMALGGCCLRALRIELLSLACHHVQSLAASSFACSAAAAAELPEAAALLAQALPRAQQELSACLQPAEVAYALGAAVQSAGTLIMWLLPQLRALSEHGLHRMRNIISVLQPALTALLPLGPTRQRAADGFAQAAEYYDCLRLSCDELAQRAMAQPHLFSLREWSALLQVNVHGRVVRQEHIDLLHEVLDRAALAN